MKTVLHVIDTTGPGGAETVFVALAAGLDATRYRSIALIRGPGWVQDSLEAAGVPTHVLDCKGSFNVRYLRQLLALIRRERVDVIQSHLLGSNVYCALASLLSRRPLVATFHGGVDVAAGERFLGLKFGLINLAARRVVAVSRALGEELAARAGLSPGRTSVIYNGIDTALFDRARNGDLRERLGVPADAVLVGALGNIRPAKDYPTLIEAFARLAEARPNAHLVIAGQGKGRLMDSLLAQRAARGLEGRVHFLGFVDAPADYLAGLDLFVLSSSSEGFSIATIQAMAAGQPVVATRSGGPEEIITDGEDGLLVARESPEALADGLARLLEDAPLRQRLAARAVASVRARFDLRAMVEAYQALY